MYGASRKLKGVGIGHNSLDVCMQCLSGYTRAYFSNYVLIRIRCTSSRCGPVLDYVHRRNYELIVFSTSYLHFYG
jgi:hypothetical protein